MSWRKKYGDYSSRKAGKLPRHDNHNGMLNNLDYPNAFSQPTIGSLDSPRNSPRPSRRMLYGSPLSTYTPTVSSEETKKSKKSKDSQKPIDEKQSSKLRDVLSAFADNTSFQGVPFIRRSLHWYSRLAWGLVFVFAISAWIFHTYYLMNVFFGYGSTSQVQIGYATLDFPSITLCNINPVKKMKLDPYASDNLISFLDALTPPTSFQTSIPSAKRRRKRQAGTGQGPRGPQGSGTRQRTTQTPEQTQQTQGQMQGSTQSQVQGPTQAPAQGSTQAPAQGPTQPVGQVPTQAPAQGPTQAPAQGPTQPVGQGPTQAPAQGPTQPAPQGPTQAPAQGPTQTQAQGPTQASAQGPTQASAQGPTQPAAQGPTPTPAQGPNQPASQGPSQGPSQPSGQGPNSASHNQPTPPPRSASFGTGNVSNNVVTEATFKQIYSQIPRRNRTLMGHQASTMILDCSFNGIECTHLNFTRTQTLSYGNCFTFNSVLDSDTSLMSSRSGSEYGLNLLLYIENHEYLSGFRGGRGIRLDVHQFNTLPNVLESGMSFSPGFESYVGMKMINSTRLGGNYGACSDDGSFQTFYKTLYTKEGCINSCVSRTIVNQCNCTPVALNPTYRRNFTDLPRCFLDVEAKACAKYYRALFDYGQINCSCNQACVSVEYDILTSYNTYPDGSLLYQLLDSVCSGDDTSQCKHVRDATQSMTESEKQTFLNRNFMRLSIFYRDLNYQQVTEKPEYEESQFISDLGGCIGLWVGASAITIMELVDLLIHCCQFCCKKSNNPRDRDKFNDVNLNNGRPQDYYDHYGNHGDVHRRHMDISHSPKRLHYYNGS